jgi:UDP-glucuronate decarboxylase
MPDASLYKLLYAPYFSITESDGVIVMNPYSVYAAKGRRLESRRGPHGPMEQTKIPTPEDHPIILEFYAERDSYAASKAFGEFYTRYVAGRRPNYLILRIFNTYGPRMDTSEYGQVIPEFIRKVLREEEFTIIGDGTQTRAFMHVDDHVRIVKRLVETGPYNDVYNVGSSQEVAILELARIMHEIVGRSFKPVFLPPRPHDRKRRCPDITKIIKATGLTPQIDLYTGLRQTTKWYMENTFSQ